MMSHRSLASSLCSLLSKQGSVGFPDLQSSRIANSFPHLAAALPWSKQYNIVNIHIYQDEIWNASQGQIQTDKLTFFHKPWNHVTCLRHTVLGSAAEWSERRFEQNMANKNTLPQIKNALPKIATRYRTVIIYIHPRQSCCIQSWKKEFISLCSFFISFEGEKVVETQIYQST